MRKRGTIIFIFIVLILVMGLGYAFLNSDLNINGITNVSSANWNVYWDSLNVAEGSVTDVTTAAHILTGETEVEFNVNFTKPGDFYEFTVDAVNDGTIDAMIDNLTKGVYATNGTTPKTLPDYLTYSVTYSDGVEIEDNHLLSAGHTETYKVRVEYKTDIEANQLPSTADNYMFKIAVNYKQADSNATTVSHSQTVYTTNIWGGNYPIVNGVYDTSRVWIGQTIPNGITTYQTPALAMAALKQASENVDRPFFLKHTITNNIVTESYLGFVVTDAMAQSNPGMTAGTYYLNGTTRTKEYVLENDSWQCMSQYDDGNGNCLDPEYNANKATLLSAFGSSYCTEDSYGITCRVSGLRVYVYFLGSVDAYDGTWGCGGGCGGHSECYNKWT